MISVAILDSQHRLFQEGLAAIISGNDEFTLTGKYSSIADFLRDARSIPVNILVISIYPDHSPEIDLIKMISREFMHIKVLVISADIRKETLFESIKAGAKGYLTSQDQGSEIFIALYSIRNGYDYYNKSISDIMMNSYSQSIENQSADKYKPLDSLSKREIEIIKFWGDGLSNKEMADKLFISVRTVESHKNHIMQKLNLKANIDLMKFAIRNNLIKI